MMFRIKLVALTFLSSFSLLLVLCLGSQNLKNRHELNLGITETAPLPTGFIIGISIISGVISGGTTAALLINKSIK